ncbi:MAG: hypothetical protein ACSLFQ_23465 [Thermoanaerobaculia bacterium]
MATTRFIEHDGIPILEIDFSSCRGPEYQRRIDEAAAVIRAQPEDSLLTLTIVTGAEYSAAIMEVMRPYVAANKPYVRFGAVVGLGHLEKAIAPVNRLTGRELATFDDAEDAKAWLVERWRES